MKAQKYILLHLLLSVIVLVHAQNPRQKILFDDGWKFFKGDAKGAEAPSFDDNQWRNIDLPHDWSIEKLSGQKAGEVVGPFSRESSGNTATGYTIGGTAWYRKTFTLKTSDMFSRTIIDFDGVYMNSDVWVNGQFAGNHPYGYTAFQYDITGLLNPAGKPNVIAIKVRNEGKNSRWYSGSGIYRHVWLIRKQAVGIAYNGVCVNTESLGSDEATLKISALVENKSGKKSDVKLLTKIIAPNGQVVKKTETAIKTFFANDNDHVVQNLTVENPQLWSVGTPNLYTTEIRVMTDGVVTDKVSTTFGIRTLHFDAQTGFMLNGKKLLLKGGCMHHDNGFLGSAAIDRAEERRVELMKAYGFNAIRTSHNPPSRQFLDACDRIGILVIEEAFDMWEKPKNPDDYHLYFKDWWQKDLESMILRDRNHPSVILWSIGNEINERADSTGYVITKKLAGEVRKLDPTRPVTEAVCGFWDHPGKDWVTTAPAFASLDVAGYNYLRDKYEPDHAQFPHRIMMGMESYPGDIYSYWEQVEKNSWVIGDFVWTAMDYLGETGVGNSSLDNGPKVGLKPWPWFNAFCGDIDLCGFKKPQLFYRDVVWRNSPLEIMVHTPIPEGRRETVSYWGWPDEFPSWNWPGNEGKIMDVRVFSRYPAVQLKVNGKIIAEQQLSVNSKYIANFKVPYEPGILKVVAVKDGVEVTSKELKTVGVPANIKLTADRLKIKADRNDLSYVRVEITDKEGNVIPNANNVVTFSISGVGEIAGSGNASPYDMESFNSPVCKIYRGQALVILRPLKNGKKGTITLRAEANGLLAESLNVTVQ